MTRRAALHQEAVGRVLEELRTRQIRVVGCDLPHGIDVQTESQLIAVRVSAIRKTHRLYRDVRYTYPGALWNLHQHGRRVAYPDLWVLYVAPAWDAYVVPAELVWGRLTVEMTLGDPSDLGRPRHAAIRACHGAWHQLRGGVEVAA